MFSKIVDHHGRRPTGWGKKVRQPRGVLAALTTSIPGGFRQGPHERAESQASPWQSSGRRHEGKRVLGVSGVQREFYWHWGPLGGRILDKSISATRKFERNPHQAHKGKLRRRSAHRGNPSDRSRLPPTSGCNVPPPQADGHPGEEISRKVLSLTSG
jgi:hypothetical protein